MPAAEIAAFRLRPARRITIFPTAPHRLPERNRDMRCKRREEDDRARPNADSGHRIAANETDRPAGEIFRQGGSRLQGPSHPSRFPTSRRDAYLARTQRTIIDTVGFAPPADTDPLPDAEVPDHIR